MKKVILLGIGLALSGCSAADIYVKSAFKTPDSSGQYNSIGGGRTGSGTNALGGYGWEVGDTGGNGFRAYAGLLSGSTVLTPPPSTGSATMTGTYSVGEITGIDISSGMIQGFASSNSGNLTLLADFGAQTLTGTSGDLTVDGTFEGTNLEGTVTYDGATAKLDGLVGATAALGAFHGRTDTSLIAGGFEVDTN